MTRSRLFFFARFLDMLWWVLIFAFAYAAYTDVGARAVLGMTLFRWVIRGLHRLSMQLEQERAERSPEYGPH